MDTPNDHPSIEALVLPHRGQMPSSEAADQERDHLHAVCPECARIWQRFLELRRQEGGRLDGAAAERARLQTRAMQARLAGDRRIAEREVERLLDLEDPAERRATVERALKRYRTPAFVERMIEEARLYLRRNHLESLALLELAELQVPKIARHIYGGALIERLSLRVRAHQANTLRVAGDLPAAEARFAEISEQLASESTAADALLGELASLEASLRYDQRRLRQAEALLERAEDLFRRTGDTTGLVKVLVQRGLILYTSGRPERAIPCFEAAASSVDAGRDPELAIAPRHNLVLSLCDAGHPDQARELLESSRDLYERLADPVSTLRRLWAEGKIAMGLSEDEDALRRLRAARDGYADRGLEFDAALVSLDLAAVHLRQGDTPEVKRLAERVAHTFADRGVDREARRAVAIFYKAACAEAVTQEIIARTRSALLRVSLRPRVPPA